MKPLYGYQVVQVVKWYDRGYINKNFNIAKLTFIFITSFEEKWQHRRLELTYEIYFDDTVLEALYVIIINATKIK